MGYHFACTSCGQPRGARHWSTCAYANLTSPYVIDRQCHKVEDQQRTQAADNAEARVLAIRGSYDAPGFEACVKAEMAEDKCTDIVCVQSP